MRAAASWAHQHPHARQHIGHGRRYAHMRCILVVRAVHFGCTYRSARFSIYSSHRPDMCSSMCVSRCTSELCVLCALGRRAYYLEWDTLVWRVRSSLCVLLSVLLGCVTGMLARDTRALYNGTYSFGRCALPSARSLMCFWVVRA